MFDGDENVGGDGIENLVSSISSLESLSETKLYFYGWQHIDFERFKMICTQLKTGFVCIRYNYYRYSFPSSKSSPFYTI